MEGKKKAEKKTAVYLTCQEAERFKIFQQFYDEFDLMVRNGVFGFISGDVVISRDEHGKIRKIKKEEITFKR